MQNVSQLFEEATVTRTSEDDLVRACQNGSVTAFESLYQSHHRRVYGLCFRMLANTSSAEDVCQEVFVQVWQTISKFKFESKFSTWLHSVATYVVLSHIRKQKTWLQKVFSIEEQTLPEQGQEMPELSNLDQKILQLPERARMVFVLFAIEGYRHEEIAQMLKINVGSSKSQYHRARQLLQEMLDNEHE